MKGWKIFILVFLLYFVSVFGGFVQDDVKVIEMDPQMGKVSSLVAVWTRPYYYLDGNGAGTYRPMTSFSLYLNSLVTGVKPWGFHLGNVLMYAGVCLLVFKILEKLKAKNAALWALLFVVMPIHSEAVSNIVGRGEILSLGFVLLSIWFQLRKKWEISAVIYLLALLSKETAIVGLPILLYLLLIGEAKKEEKGGTTIFYILITVTYLILRLIVLGGDGMKNNATLVENPIKYVSNSERVMTAFSLITFGLEKTVFPLNLSYDYSFNQLKLVTNLRDTRTLIGVGLMLLSLSSLLTNLRKNKVWILGMAFFWGPIVVTGNFLFPVGTIFGERLWFWSSLGLIFLLSTLFNPAVFANLKNRTLFDQRQSRSCFQPKTFRIQKDQAFWLCAIFFKSVKYFGLALIIFYAVRTVVRNTNWLSQESLFIHDAAYVKDSVMAQSNKAAMLLIKGDLESGKEAMEMADKIYPKYPELLNNWGMYYLWTGDKISAKEKFEECLVERQGYYLCESNLKLLEN